VSCLWPFRFSCAYGVLALIPHYYRGDTCCCIPSYRHYHVGGCVWFTSHHIYFETRVYACRLDGGLYRFVRFLPAFLSNSSVAKRECRYPVYSFFLPVYSFWCMDEFSWGNTRVVVGEGKEKKVLMSEEEKFDESMIPLKKFSGAFLYIFFSYMVG
jgi:hypothetical protein